MYTLYWSQPAWDFYEILLIEEGFTYALSHWQIKQEISKSVISRFSRLNPEVNHDILDLIFLAREIEKWVHENLWILESFFAGKLVQSMIGEEIGGLEFPDEIIEWSISEKNIIAFITYYEARQQQYS